MAKTGRTVPCDQAARRGRLEKARQFLEAASIVEQLMENENDLLEACVTLWVHAGIAAADVICCVRLGVHAKGENHAEAIDLLRQAQSDLAAHLSSLISMKTRSGYTSLLTPVADGRRAMRAAVALYDYAKDLVV